MKNFLKNFLVAFALFFSCEVFAQAPAVTTAVDSVLLIHVYSDGTVDSMWVPSGGTIGDFVATDKDSFVKVGETFSTLLFAFLSVLLTFLGAFVPGLRKIKIPVLDKRVKSLIVSLLVMVGAAFIKDGKNWLDWVIKNPEFPLITSGLYALLLKPVLGKWFGGLVKNPSESQ